MRDTIDSLTSDSLELSIVMPCLNEAETVGLCVAKAIQFIQGNGIRGEVLVADNGSTDGSQELARSKGARVVDIEQKGYGNALAGGIRAAKGRWIIMGDSDDSYDFLHLEKFVAELRNGADLVMGNRFKGGLKPGAMPFLHRWLGNPVLSGLGRLFFQNSVGDFHCGLRGFSRSSYERLDLQTTGMEFASEMVVKATIMGMKITEVPTVLSPAGRTRPPHLRTWRDGWRHLRFMLLYSPRWLFLYPGLILMLVGLGAGLWILPGPQKIGTVTFDIHSLLYAALAVLLGFQSVLFAVFTKAFGIAEGLLPVDRNFSRLMRLARLELGLVTGGGLILLGIFRTLHAIGAWGKVSFGPLDPTQTFRMIIPAFLALALGLQIVFASFFLSVLRLNRKGARQE